MYKRFKNNNNKNTNENKRKRLAQRVILRLLEECMIDECTKEEENDLLSDLCISQECDEDDISHRNQRLKAI